MRFLGKLMFKRRKRGLVHGNFLHYTPRKVLVGVARHAGAKLQPENSTSLENIQWKLSTYVTNGICLIIFSAPIAEYIHACSNTVRSLSATPTPRKKTEAVSRRETRKDEGISPHFYFQENDDSLKIKHITLYDQEGYIPV